MVTKDKILALVEQMDSDISFEEAMDQMYLLYKIENGIAQADAGNTLTQEEAKERMKHCF